MLEKSRYALSENAIARHYTWRLLATSSLLTLSSANFAFDNQGFSQTQAMNAFINRFGHFDEEKGRIALTANFLAYSNAFPLLLLVCGEYKAVYHRALTDHLAIHRHRDRECYLLSFWQEVDCLPHVALGSNLHPYHRHQQESESDPCRPMPEFDLHRHGDERYSRLPIGDRAQARTGPCGGELPAFFRIWRDCHVGYLPQDVYPYE